jgi:signal transduction histidine kinase
MTLDREAGLARCTVEDVGPGFRLQDLGLIFEPFYTRRNGGTGLGLSYVQRVIADHQGTVTASNREDRGARLTVELPVVAEPVVAEPLANRPT